MGQVLLDAYAVALKNKDAAGKTPRCDLNGILASVDERIALLDKRIRQAENDGLDASSLQAQRKDVADKRSAIAGADVKALNTILKTQGVIDGLRTQGKDVSTLLPQLQAKINATPTLPAKVNVTVILEKP